MSASDTAVAQAIEAIQQISTDLVTLPGDDAYNELTASYFSALNRDLKPTAFLTPNSTKDVSTIVKTLSSSSFKDKLKGKVAICGAGQQATPGVANARDGLTIHLRGLRGIEIDKESMVVRIGAGEKMGDVYNRLGEMGLGFQGNRHSTGGISGDALQGGLSYFSYKRGFVCDDVVNFEVVDADGSIVQANAEANSDLWVALKGGGGGGSAKLGIVTRFDVRIFEVGRMWGGKVFYFPSSLSSQIQALVPYLHSATPDLEVHICLSMGYAAALGDVMCMNDIFCTRPETTCPKALEPFARVEGQVAQMNTLRVGDLKGFADEVFAGAEANRVVKMSTTVKADTTILEFAVEVFRTSFEKLKGVTNILFSLTFESIPVSLIEASLARGGNSLGLAPDDGPLVVVLFYTSWDEASYDKLVYEVNKEAVGLIEVEAEKRGVASRYRYMNYASPNQDIFESYGDESKQRLLAVSREYDPEGFWQTVGAGPFKLFD